jgi:hypothetical protein
MISAIGLSALDGTAGRLSASETTARATATAADRSGAWTVTTLMIFSHVCAHDALIPARCGLPGCGGEPGRIRTAAAIGGHGHGDVVPDGWFSHARNDKSGIRHSAWSYQRADISGTDSETPSDALGTTR